MHLGIETTAKSDGQKNQVHKILSNTNLHSCLNGMFPCHNLPISADDCTSNYPTSNFLLQIKHALNCSMLHFSSKATLIMCLGTVMITTYLTITDIFHVNSSESDICLST